MCKLGQKKLREYAERLRLPLVAGYVVSHWEYVLLAEFKEQKRWMEFMWDPRAEWGVKLKRKWVGVGDEVAEGREGSE